MRIYIIFVIIILVIATGCNNRDVDKFHTELTQVAVDEVVTMDSVTINSDNQLDNTKKEGQQVITESSEFILDLGDKIRTFKVSMIAQPFEEGNSELIYDSKLTISIYLPDNLTVPNQILFDKTNGRLFTDYVILDANYDGYNDFGYVDYRGAYTESSHFYLWNNEKDKFEYSEDLSELPLVTFDNSSKTIQANWKDSASSHSTRLYKFIEGELICIRYLYIHPSETEDIGIFGVEELRDNGLVEVVNKNVTVGNLDEIYDEYALWMNTEYFGE